jgi:hypothetical protein
MLSGHDFLGGGWYLFCPVVGRHFVPRFFRLPEPLGDLELQMGNGYCLRVSCLLGGVRPNRPLSRCLACLVSCEGSDAIATWIGDAVGSVLDILRVLWNWKEFIIGSW